MLDGKPIQIRPSAELRKKLEEEKRHQNRSLNNLVIVILTKFFNQKESAAR